MALYGINAMEFELQPLTAQTVSVGRQTIDAKVDLGLLRLQVQLPVGLKYDFA
ncbi:hypothetical protein ALQ55_200025 [Pseudomonas savastanoi pv. savastanoi]|nr:hypothetical protein ALQ55_200025 [Pseudomonas savastanoi pv. savastanoi]